jgi:hypothetical protein
MPAFAVGMGALQSFQIARSNDHLWRKADVATRSASGHGLHNLIGSSCCSMSGAIKSNKRLPESSRSLPALVGGRPRALCSG